MVASIAAVVLVLRWNATGTALSVVGVLELGIDAGVRLLFTILLFVVGYTNARVLKRFLLGSGSSKHRVTSDH